MKNFLKNYWAVLIPVLVLAAAVTYLLSTKKNTAASQDQIIGMVDAEFVDVASSLPGRIASIAVNLDDHVTAGQKLIQLETDKISTLKSQADNLLVIAQSQNNQVEEGVRPEVLAAAENLESIAKEQMNLMATTYSRFQNLYSQGVISGQERDLVYFKYKAAQKELETARLNVAMLKKGNNSNARKASSALSRQAEDANKLIQQIEESATITAPFSGTVATLVSKTGEVVNAGYPIMTLRKDESYFIKFNIRQDLMAKFKKGQKVKLKIPGATPETVDATITELAPALGYADWVPEKQTGDIEMRTFQIKVSPQNRSESSGLKTGMTAQLISY